MLNSFTDRRMLFLAFVLSCLFSVVCIAAPGDLDPSFGSGGVATDYIGAEITVRSVAIQADGKIVVIGTRKLADSQFLPPKDRLFIRRYTSTGALDHNQSFPSLILGTGIDAEFQIDGKLVVLGKAPNSYSTSDGTVTTDSPVVWRFNTDGSLDTSFGVHGSRFIDNIGIGDLQIDQFHGRMFIAYSSRLSYFPNRLTTYKITRLSSTGSIDFTIEPPLVYGGQDEKKFSMKVDRTNGNIFVLGIKPTSLNVVVDAYDLGGSVLTDFGLNGETSAPDCVSQELNPKDLVIQPDGKLLVLRYSYALNGYVCISRLLTAGSQDPSFVSYLAYLPDQVGSILTLQPDGKMFFYVGAFGGSWRVNSDGTFDRPLYGIFYYPSAIQPDQKRVSAQAEYPEYKSVRIERRLLD